MTTKPELKLGSHLVPGLAAVALFAVMAAVFLTASFPEPQGFADDANIVASIGYAMFDLDFGSVASESFLAAFLIMAVLLDVALDGAVLLARREPGESTVKLVSDGGKRLRETLSKTERGQPEDDD
ncbi:proton-conducting membrane transporter [Halogeometricum luteum]|jgi:NADH-quinone oxidoreductase subunit J|uniref:Proton-conducting membrane transporter n=1 Tax=Halogeometricum luteum TaxID=2950537 RepID=A0ABU2FXD2_9EURY|nr:proton-conducting membrane transporter [Halogeometricum sp. S3BR5-2]MDS0293206.1 proton-conducting membrane transporter [Halogeometricum sp. S3BR5-2]